MPDITSTSSHSKNLTASHFKLSSHWQGACWKILSCAAFAGINGIVRYLSGGGEVSPADALPTNVIMFFQNVFGTLFLLPILYSAKLNAFPTRFFHLHFSRIITAVLGVSLWYLTLKYTPLAESVALTFTGPIFTVIGARFLLHETLGMRRIFAIILCFIGAFVISRLDLTLLGLKAGLGWTALLPLSSAIALAWNKLITRKLTLLGEKPESLATYLLFLMAPISLIPALFEWSFPSLLHWPWLMLLGLLAAIAHLTFVKAYKCAEVTFLTPFGFSKFLFSTLVGFIFFTEIPTSSLWIGILIIGMSIALLAYRMPLYSIANLFKSNWFRKSE